MEKNTALGIMLTLLFSGALTFTFNVQLAEAWTGSVEIHGGEGLGFSPSDAPIERNGDVYTLTDDITSGASGIVIVTSDIVLDGAGHTLRGAGTGTGVDVSSLSGYVNVAIRNLKIKEFAIGMKLVSFNTGTVCENTITDNSDGIRVTGWGQYSSYLNLVSGNTITDNENGIVMDGAVGRNLISENIITDNSNHGIALTTEAPQHSPVTDNIIDENTITNNGDGVSLTASSDNLIRHNKITGALDLLQLSNNNTILGNVIAGGMYLAESSGNTISDNNITGGIGFVDGSYDNTISLNNVIDGIWMYSDLRYNVISGNNIRGGVSLYQNSEYNTISYNNITGGIGLVRYSSFNIISGNNIAGSSYDGIILQWSSSDNTISGNVIRDNAGNGILLSTEAEPVTNNRILGNNITSNVGDGVRLEWNQVNNTVSRNDISNNGGSGIDMYTPMEFDMYPGNNMIIENDIRNNKQCGIHLLNASNNFIYHNNFVDNADQVYSENSINVWDDGYPSGGNYWSDYTDVDFYNGPSQDLFGMDGIWDHPYVIDAENQDRYPFVKPRPIIPAATDVDPDRWSLRSKGNRITVYIELPTGYDVNNVDVASIKLNDAFPVDFSAPKQVGDYDLDGTPDLMVKFNRAQLESYIYNVLGIKYGQVTLKMTGQLNDGTPFDGSDTIWVNYAGDVNNDGKINILDAATVSARWSGPPIGPLGYDSDSDLNNDGLINILDSGMVSDNWGQTAP